MESASEYLDRVKDCAGITTDSDIAKGFGINRSVVRNWRTGRGFPSEKRMLALAEKANLDPSEALILLRFWKSHGDTKKAYETALKRIARGFPYIFLGLLAYGGKIDKAEALQRVSPYSLTYETSHNATKYKHYASFWNHLRCGAHCVLEWLYTTPPRDHAVRNRLKSGNDQSRAVRGASCQSTRNA